MWVITQAAFWAALFPDRFYLELQRAGRPEDELQVTAAVQLAGPAISVSCAACNHSILANCTNTKNFLDRRGLTVVDEAGNAILMPPDNALGRISSGAAYVLISPMAEGGGGYSSAGSLLASSVPAGTNGEDRNANNQGIPAAGYFHDSRIISGSGAGAAHFDDLLSHPSVMQLLMKAQLAPRSQ